MVRRSRSIAAALAVSLAAAACGGGGGGSNSPASTVERYPVGGTVGGLTAAGLVLQNNGGDDLVVNASGPFHFPAPVDDGARYAVTVKVQPPGQRCSVSGGTGTVSGGAVTTVAVTCAGGTFRVGGTVSGLSGPGLVLQDNGGDDLAVDADGAFTFATPLATGGGYAVSVKTQPPGERCTVSGGTGTISGADVRTVTVTCSTLTFTVGGGATGLGGAGLVLQDNGGDDLSVDADGVFTFATPVADGAGYAVTVRTQPPGRRCAVSGGVGTIAGANVRTVTVTCTTLTFTVGGDATGLGGAGLVLQDNGGDDLAVDADGAFTFATALPYAAGYAVTVRTEPAGRHCTVGGGVGTVTADVTTVTVTCIPLTFTVGGTVSGLGGAGLVLQDNGGDDLTVDADGAFTFAISLAAGDAYAVTVRTQPAGMRCTVAGGAGTIPAANVTGVSVTCAPATYAIAGTVTGLRGAGLVLQDNGGDDLSLDADGVFTFATRLGDGAAYAVTVRTQPSGQVCTVTGGAGNVAGADVPSVTVACDAATFRVGGRVTGLTAPGLVLQDNGGDSLSLDADGAFTFATPIPNGGAYAVTVSAQPAGLRCTVSSGSGAVAGADVSTVRVTCASVGSFVVSGTVSGLAGAGLVLRDNGGDDLPVDADGAFTFATPVADGAPYAVTVASHPARTRCAVANGAGIVAGADVTGVTVTCHRWTIPAPARTGGGSASSPVLAFDPSGVAIAAWIELDAGAGTTHVYAARYAGASETWETATRIDSLPGDASAPDLAIDPYFGEALVVWRQDSGGTLQVWSNRFGSGAWGTAQRLDTGGFSVTSAPKVSVDAIGNAFAVWTQRGSGGFEDVWSARYELPLLGGAGWGTPVVPVRVDTSDAGDAAAPSVSYTSGIGVALWQQPDGTRTRIWSARWTQSARWAGVNAPVLVDAGAAGASAPELAVDLEGNAFATWQQPDPSDAARLRVWASRYDASSTWADPVALDTSATSMRLAAVTADGKASPAGPNAFAVWRAQGGPDVHASRYDHAGGRWSPPERIGGGVADPGERLLSAAADADGNALALWHDGARIRASRFTPGAGWDGELQVDTATAATAPVVRFDGAGNALALWIQQDGGGAWQVMSARHR